MTKCVGCGIKLQNKNVNEVGYTPDLKNELCERCFKLKNYNVLTNKGINIDNDKLINKKYVINLLDEHIQGKKDNSRKVWTVFMFCLWYEIYIEGKSIEELEKYNDFNRSDSKSKLA